MRVLAFILLFFTSINANSLQEYSFVGISVISENAGFNAEDERRETGLSLRYGQQTQEWRTTFSLEHHKDLYNSLAVEVDKILLDDMFGTAMIRPYLGLGVGYMRVDDALNNTYGQSNGFYYGGRFGFIFYTSDDMDVDIGYRYYKVTNLDYLDDLHGASLAIHYFF